jgi:hypothetical protein
MLELDESVEEMALIRVIGIGTFGLRVVGNMVGCIHQVECLGVVTQGTDEPGNLPLVSLPLNSNQDHHDVAALMEKLGTSDNYIHEPGLMWLPILETFSHTLHLDTGYNIHSVFLHMVLLSKLHQPVTLSE